MPSDLTIFAAKYLVFLDALAALAILVFLVRHRSREDLLRFAVSVGILLILSYVGAHLAAAAYSDPRPFTEDHVKPLISHARDNGFPSDHALLAAAIVAAVFIVSPLWCIPFVVLGFLVDWARVGAGIHHVLDVVGSSVIVAVAAVIAVLVAPKIVELLMSRVPAQQRAGQ